jgi:hypothetical protein
MIGSRVSREHILFFVAMTGLPHDDLLDILVIALKEQISKPGKLQEMISVLWPIGSFLHGLDSETIEIHLNRCSQEAIEGVYTGDMR